MEHYVMRGRKPTPTAMKIANGNPGRRPLNMHEPCPTGLIAKPEWVNGETLEVWRHIVPLLEGMGVMTAADCEAVGRYCDAIALWQRARKFVHERGSTYPIRSKDPVIEETVDPLTGGKRQQVTYPIISIAQYPQVAEYRQLSKLLLAFESEFGLTAAARTRIEVHELPRGDLSSDEQAKRDFFRIGSRHQATRRD
jgi:P27 family predicted phage terminase small subunit